MTLDQPQQERQPALNIPASILAVLILCFAIYALRTYVLGNDADAYVWFYGAFIPARYMESLSWEAITTPATYSLLHGSFGHLINNAVWLVAFGSPVAKAMNNMRFLLFWIACSVIAALFHYLADPASMVPMIGASGAVSGMMGAAARSGFRLRADIEADQPRSILPPISLLIRSRSVMGFLGFYLLVNVGIGALGATGGAGVTSIAWQAHIGGLIAGFLLLPLFLRESRR